MKNKCISEYLLKLSWLSFLPLIIVGSIFYEERLGMGGISLNTILFVISLCSLSLSVYLSNGTIKTLDFSIISLFFFIAFAPLFFYTSDASIDGVLKYSDSLAIGVLGAVILSCALTNNDIESYFNNLILFMLVLFISAIVWKLAFGFWRREIPYFMNGSIVFGRNMAVGFFAVLLFPPKNIIIKKILFFIFSFGVLWSMSKGPIISFLICFSFYLYFESKFKFIFSIFIITVLFYLILFNYIDFSGTALYRLQVGLQVVTGVSDSLQAAGSVNIRADMFHLTYNAIKNNLFTGVGAGRWSEYFYSDFTYPHNIFLEVFFDLGLIYGLVFLFPYVSFIVHFKNYFYIFPLFFFISHQMSGDVADARWLLLFSMLVILNKSMRVGQLKIE